MIASFLSHLQREAPKRVDISERLDLCRKKPAYTPATEVASPDVPHFARATIDQAGAAEHSNASLPIIQAPVICQLCGAGLLSQKDLWRHAQKEHHSWAGARKRFIFEVQQRMAVPLRPIEKRRLASNFMQDLLYSRPGRNTVRPGECTMRQIVACAVCAVKDWIDDFYPCYMWKETPSPGNADDPEHGDDHDTEDEEDHTYTQERSPVARRERFLLFWSSRESP